MGLDRFVDSYVGLLNAQIEICRSILETKNFVALEEFTKVQGRLQGLKEALELLRSIPEDD
jgi:hypothetical protein